MQNMSLVTIQVETLQYVSFKTNNNHNLECNAMKYLKCTLIISCHIQTLILHQCILRKDYVSDKVVSGFFTVNTDCNQKSSNNFFIVSLIKYSLYKVHIMYSDVLLSLLLQLFTSIAYGKIHISRFFIIF